MARRISSLTKGEKVTLKFHSRYTPVIEVATFLGLSEDGQRAKFKTPGRGHDRGYTWEAYRYQGHWAYGSSADRLSVIE